MYYIRRWEIITYVANVLFEEFIWSWRGKFIMTTACRSTEGWWETFCRNMRESIKFELD